MIAAAILQIVVVDRAERVLPDTDIFHISIFIIIPSSTAGIFLRRTSLHTQTLVEIVVIGTASADSMGAFETIRRTLSVI